MSNCHLFIAALCALLATASCIPHRSFVATPYEPVLVKKKGDFEASAGFRPMKYFSLLATVAPTDNVAIRMGYGGFFNLDNFSASVIYFKNHTKYGYFVAPSYNYQHNTIVRSLPLFFSDGEKSYNYNCKYHSPGLALGFTIQGDFDDPSQQIILKIQYNLVKKYHYGFYKDGESGSGQLYTVLDNETLDKLIPNFFSFEPSYVFLKPVGPYFNLKLQLGATFCQRAYKHDYQFNAGYFRNYEAKNASKWHPVYFPVNFGAGLIFNISAKEKKRFDPNAFN